MAEKLTGAVGGSVWRRSAPALVLIVLAPLIAEVLPGATRLSALFVLPIEMCVWGGGALAIREVVRRRQLGWPSMLLLALALAVAEECLIQQTSLAPVVIRLKGVEYARACGVNYVYLLWALVYEAVFVVFVPIHLAEMIFASRRHEAWLGKGGLIALPIVFLIGSGLAWFSWTQIARPQVFHVPAYQPPPRAVAIAGAVVLGLVSAALNLPANLLASRPLKPPAPWQLGTLGGVWAVLWYGLVLLGYGIMPSFPPAAASGAGALLVVGIVAFLPRWAADPRWGRCHTYGLILGTMLGSWLAGFIGFLGSARADLIFKIVVDVVAFGLLLGLRKDRATDSAARSQSLSDSNVSP